MSGPPNINSNQLPSSSSGGGVGGSGSGRGWLRTPPPTYFRSPSPWVPPGSAPPRQSSPVTAPRPVDGSSAAGPPRGPSEFVYQHPSSGAFGGGGAGYPPATPQQYATGERHAIRAATATPGIGAPAQEYHQFQRPIPSAMTPTHFAGPSTHHYRPVSPAAVAPQPYPQFSSTMSPVSSLHRSMTPHSVGSVGYGPMDYQHPMQQQPQQVRPGSTQSSVYGGVTYHYGPAAGPSHPSGQSQYVIYDYGGEMGPSTAEIIAAQSQDYVDEKLAEYQATIMLLQGEFFSLSDISYWKVV
uniref:Uncharacterized protein n=1 Tax=Anopheles epiroticus TaxID=199890 RepID=A0A182PB42_9DIPT